MNIHLKRCEKCRDGFDITTNFPTCSDCRIKREEENERSRRICKRVR